MCVLVCVVTQCVNGGEASALKILQFATYNFFILGSIADVCVNKTYISQGMFDHCYCNILMCRFTIPSNFASDWSQRLVSFT